MQSGDQHSDPKQVIDKLNCSHHRHILAQILGGAGSGQPTWVRGTPHMQTISKSPLQLALSLPTLLSAPRRARTWCLMMD
jgi:hypothetical protein